MVLVSMIQHTSAPEVLTLDEAATMLGLTPVEVMRLIESQALPARQIDGRWFFARYSLQYWMITERTKAGMLNSARAFKDDPTFAEVVAIIEENRRSDDAAYKARILALAGTFKDDPDLEAITEEICRARGRPITDDRKDD